ncbi:MAG: LysR family transcriptional regulator [Candidatus Tectomicrobia bacterium]|nr:LysR family transcriptional regulator [Candidatus Tectomicrobia bacterium]
MHLTDLHYFQTIAHYGNITAAARTLGVRQPTLTVAMHRLEAEIGTTLFLRDRSGVTLTDTGKAFLQYVSEALSLLDVGTQHVQGLETDDVGSFILGVPSALGSYFLPSFFPDFLRQAPRIDVSLWTGTGQAVYQAVLTRDVHFGLVVNPTPHPELVLTQLFHDATDFFVASSSEDMAHPVNTGDANSRSIDWDTVCAQLRTGPLVYVSYMSQAHVLRERLGTEQLLPVQQLRCGELEVVKSLALAGVGVAILPRRVAASDPLKRLHRLHPDLPFIHDAVYLIHRADLHRTQAVARLKDALVTHGQRLGSDAESQLIQQEIVRQTHKTS